MEESSSAVAQPICGNSTPAFADHPWLMVFGPGSSRRILLPDDGELTVGSDVACTVCLNGDGLVPFHAVIQFGAEEVRLLASPAGGLLLLNDEPVDDSRPLASGDAITIGPFTLVFHDRAGRGTRRAVLAYGAFRTRLRQEVERCLRAKGSLGVVALRLGGVDSGEPAVAVGAALASVRQIDVVGWDGGREILIALPETGDSVMVPAGRVLAAVGSVLADARAGVAQCPVDAHDADGLIAGARNAAFKAGVGVVASVASSVVSISLGDRPLLAADPAMRRLLALVERLASSDLPVLIEGETGVGKEMVALALHEGSDRRGRPFLAINCAAVTETLFESELFGHERGAFTGATATKKGQLEMAQGGTVLLDEIGDCPLHVQPKLLRVLETRRIARVGAVVELPIDVRILAATNRNLEDEVEAGRFRRDLFFRLATARVTVPPLRERPLDVPVLARDFLSRAFDSRGRRPPDLSPEAMRRLVLHDWPGNVRELRSLMEFCAATVEVDVLQAHHLPDSVARAAARWLAEVDDGSRAQGAAPSRFGPLDTRLQRSLGDEIRELEKTRILQALAATGGVRVEAARLLGMPLRTLVTRLAQFGINQPGRRMPPRAD